MLIISANKIHLSTKGKDKKNPWKKFQGLESDKFL
jgi:hypothetical protein